MMICLGEEVTHEKELNDLKDLITKIEVENEQLKAENAALRERLEKAVELPCIEIKKHTSPKVIYNLIYRNELGNITVYEYPAFMQSVAFARLAELKGGNE